MGPRKISGLAHTRLANQAEPSGHHCLRGTVAKERRFGSFSHEHPLSPPSSCTAPTQGPEPYSPFPPTPLLLETLTFAEVLHVATVYWKELVFGHQWMSVQILALLFSAV